MMPGAIALYEEALYEEALRERATALALRTADGRALPLQISRWCGRPDAADEDLLRRCRGPPGGQLLIEAEPSDIDEQLTAWLEHSDGRRGPVFPWALMGTAALLRAAADAGLHVAGQWRYADRAFVCAARRASTHAIRALPRTRHRCVARGPASRT